MKYVVSIPFPIKIDLVNNEKTNLLLSIVHLMMQV